MTRVRTGSILYRGRGVRSIYLSGDTDSRAWTTVPESRHDRHGQGIMYSSPIPPSQDLASGRPRSKDRRARIAEKPDEQQGLDWQDAFFGFLSCKGVPGHQATGHTALRAQLVCAGRDLFELRDDCGQSVEAQAPTIGLKDVRVVASLAWRTRRADFENTRSNTTADVAADVGSLLFWSCSAGAPCGGGG